MCIHFVTERSLGQTKISLPSHFASAFGFHRKFAICLASTGFSRSTVLLGDGPYVFRPNVNAAQSLTVSLTHHSSVEDAQIKGVVKNLWASI
ncbi:hypothetical protein K1719_030804 [Acacia pycnantha]|nr:hypothetical protein K1719_030804 [Acacia pycnantha]